MSIRETDLDGAKRVAIQFLYLKPKQTVGFGFFVDHPFINTAYVADKQGPFFIFDEPKRFQSYLQQLADIINRGNLDTIFAHMLNKYHLAYLKFAKDYLSKKDFDKYLAYVWIASENPNQDATVKIRTLISWFKQANRKYLMEPNELAYYNNLPQKLNIYRGIAVGRANKEGLSWTCNYKTAEWFANRFNEKDKKGYILQGEIDKDDVFAYFNGRNEDEILCNSQKVYNITKIQL